MSIEIRELFERYADRYMAGDAEAVADMYTARSLQFATARQFTWLTASAWSSVSLA